MRLFSPVVLPEPGPATTRITLASLSMSGGRYSPEMPSSHGGVFDGWPSSVIERTAPARRLAHSTSSTSSSSRPASTTSTRHPQPDLLQADLHRRGQRGPRRDADA